MRSTSNTTSIVIALGSNLGNRALTLRRALHEVGKLVRIVRVSNIHETKPVDAPAGSPDFLNMVLVGHTRLQAEGLLEGLQAIEKKLGRRPGRRNAPRTIDLDLILYGAQRIRTKRLTVPHPRYMKRAFVMEPLRELGLDYRVP